MSYETKTNIFFSRHNLFIRNEFPCVYIKTATCFTFRTKGIVRLNHDDISNEKDAAKIVLLILLTL